MCFSISFAAFFPFRLLARYDAVSITTQRLLCVVLWRARYTVHGNGYCAIFVAPRWLKFLKHCNGVYGMGFTKFVITDIKNYDIRNNWH